MSLITAAEAKALAKPALPIRIHNQLAEVNKAICEAANGGISNISLRLPTDIAEEVLKEIRSAGFQTFPLQEPVQGMSFFRVSWI